MNSNSIQGHQPNFKANVYYASNVNKSEAPQEAIQRFADFNDQDVFVYNQNPYTGAFQTFSGDTFHLTRTDFNIEDKTYTTRCLAPEEFGAINTYR